MAYRPEDLRSVGIIWRITFMLAGNPVAFQIIPWKERRGWGQWRERAREKRGPSPHLVPPPLSLIMGVPPNCFT